MCGDRRPALGLPAGPLGGQDGARCWSCARAASAGRPGGQAGPGLVACTGEMVLKTGRSGRWGYMLPEWGAVAHPARSTTDRQAAHGRPSGRGQLQHQVLQWPGHLLRHKRDSTCQPRSSKEKACPYHRDHRTRDFLAPSQRGVTGSGVRRARRFGGRAPVHSVSQQYGFPRDEGCAPISKKKRPRNEKPCNRPATIEAEG